MGRRRPLGSGPVTHQENLIEKKVFSNIISFQEAIFIWMFTELSYICILILIISNGYEFLVNKTKKYGCRIHLKPLKILKIIP